MNFGVLSIAAGGFLLGGAFSMARLTNDDGSRGWARSDPGQRGGRLRRAAPSIGVAVILFLAAVYFVVTGILGLLAE